MTLGSSVRRRRATHHVHEVHHHVHLAYQPIHTPTLPAASPPAPSKAPSGWVRRLHAVGLGLLVELLVKLLIAALWPALLPHLLLLPAAFIATGLWLAQVLATLH